MTQAPSMPMRALTIYQPWATLIQIGAKPYEFRKWPAPKWMIGQRFVNHASARPVKRQEIQDLLLRLRDEGEIWTTGLNPELAIPLLERALTSPGILPTAAGLGTVMMGKPITATEICGARVADSDRIDQHMWGWPVSDPQPFEPVVPIRGFQGFWNWPSPMEVVA